jgi:hypothetical protein
MSVVKKKHDEDLIDLDIEDELMMEGDIMDLEIPIRDAVVLSLPINPLCSEECRGLCPMCGVNGPTFLMITPTRSLIPVGLAWVRSPLMIPISRFRDFEGILSSCSLEAACRNEKRVEKCQYQSEKCRAQRRVHVVASGKLLQHHSPHVDNASNQSCSTQHAQHAVHTTVVR